MKKRLMVLTIIILLAAIGMAAAMTVTLNSATVSGSGVTLSCLGDATDEGTLTKVEFRTNTAGAMAVNYTNISLTLATHTVTREITGIANGNYNWNCRFFNNSGSDSGNATAASDGTFTVNVASNVAPSFTGTIANVEFAEDAVKSNAFDLDTYFTDATAMTFRVTGNTSIIVSIASDSQVTFSAPANWSGAENMTFIASDGSLTNSSNGVLVNVTAANDVPYLISIVPNQTWPANTNRSLDLSGYFGDVESATLNYT
ncbi:MAG: Ig-like domain-containing protein, partial [Nanoarchaeota archaeon]